MIVIRKLRETRSFQKPNTTETISSKILKLVRDTATLEKSNFTVQCPLQILKRISKEKYLFEEQKRDGKTWSRNIWKNQEKYRIRKRYLSIEKTKGPYV